MEGKRRQRMRRAMFDLWNSTDDTCERPLRDVWGFKGEPLTSPLVTRPDISLTSHSCALRSLLAILNHTPLSLETGEMIPVVVKATKKQEMTCNGASLWIV